jgi:DNA-binding beta-propeller fold protein YncE
VGERIVRARRRRNTRRLGSALAVVAVLAAGGLLVNRTGTGPGPAALSSPSTTSTAEPRYADWRSLPAIGTGEPVDLAAADGWFYLLEESPGTVLRLDRATFAVGATAPVPDKPESLAVDVATDRLWVTYTVATGVTRVREFVASTLAPLRDVPVIEAQVFRAVALDGVLWLGTEKGLLRVGPDDQAAQAVPGFDQPVFALAVDLSRHRLLVDSPTGVTSLDPDTLAVTRGAPLNLVKESIAVVSGQVWVGGFASGEQRRIYHLDPTTLQVAGTSPVNGTVGPGAILSAGASALWVRDGADKTLSCLDPVSGAVRRQWQRGGDTIASVAGAALTVSPPNLYQLTLGDECAG